MKVRYFVYLIKSIESGIVYTGYTSNLNARIEQHNNGESGYTKGRGPWELLWYCAFMSENAAKTFEKYLKTGSGIAFARKRFLPKGSPTKL